MDSNIPKPDTERFPPPPNRPPGDSLIGKGLYAARLVADLQVSSVMIHLKPWLATISGEVLEIGCGAQPYRHLLPKGCSYQCLDSEIAAEAFGYRAPGVTYYQGGEFPLSTETFDFVYHTEVLEHVYNYATFLSECRRVLKSTGTMFFSVPFQARYHYIPNDYWRFTPAALQKSLAAAGFRQVDIFSRGTDTTVAAYKFISVVYRWIQSNWPKKLLGLLFFPFSVLALIIGHLSLHSNMGSDDDCLGFCVFAKR